MPLTNGPYDGTDAIQYGLGFLVTVVGAGWALDQEGRLLAAVAGGFAVLVDWRATLTYRAWAVGGEATASGARLGVCAGIGITPATS